MNKTTTSLYGLLLMLSWQAPLPALAEDPVEAATVASLEDWVAFLRLPNVTKQSIVLKKSVSIGPNSDSLFL
jgi:hypothetical protein